MNLAASEILKLLAIKHSGDVFVPECKDGPTHYVSHSRLDAWVMARSWSKPQNAGVVVCGGTIGGNQFSKASL